MVEFKPSFIPTKPIAAQTGSRKRPIGVLGFIAFVLFFASIAAAGGLFLYRAYLTNDFKSKSAQVARAKEAIDTSVIEDLQRLDSRIAAARQLLDKHVTVSPAFDLLEASTLSNSVRLKSFDYSFVEGKVAMKISGEARNYTSLAIQSKVFGENKFLSDQLFEGLKLGPKGFVSFNFNAGMQEEFVLFRNNLANIKTKSSGSAPVSAPASKTESLLSEPVAPNTGASKTESSAEKSIREKAALLEGN